jgi:hypothetical protein
VCGCVAWTCAGQRSGVGRGAKGSELLGDRAAADLPLFHGISRKEVLAWLAAQMQSGGGIVGTDNQQAVDGESRGARCRMSTGMRSSYRPDLEEGASEQSRCLRHTAYSFLLH